MWKLSLQQCLYSVAGQNLNAKREPGNRHNGYVVVWSLISAVKLLQVPYKSSTCTRLEVGTNLGLRHSSLQHPAALQ